MRFIFIGFVSLALASTALSQTNSVCNFSTRITIDTEEQPTSAAFGDWDNDGDQDVAVIASDSNTLSIFENSGSTLELHDIVSFPFSPAHIVAEDFDNDGIVDIAVSSTNQEDIIRIFIGTGNKEFQALPDVVFHNGTSSSFLSGKMVVQDADDDGDLDLLVTTGSQVIVMANDGEGVLTQQSAIDFPTTNLITWVATSDVNEDQCFDVIITDRSTDQLIIAINDSNGGFADQIAFDTGDNPSFIELVDVNNDAMLDIVTANDGITNNVSVFIKTATGFGDAVNYQVTGNSTEVLAAIDFDNDSDMDIVALEENAGKRVSLLENQGDGTFTPAGEFRMIYTPEFVAAVDLFGNSNKDLFLLTSRDSIVTTGNEISVFRNDGFSGIPFTQTLPTGAINSGCLADIDLDDDLDVITVGDLTSTVFANQGNGQFSVLSSGNSPGHEIAIGDLNGDQFPDIVKMNDEQIHIEINDNNGFFNALPITYTIPNLSHVFVSDTNEDGFLDVVYTVEVINNLYFFGTLLNDGSGSLIASPETYELVEPIHDIKIADLNNDGSNDFVVNGLHGRIDIFFNDGTGFNAGQGLSLGRGIAIGDIDGDGRRDIVSSSGRAMFNNGDSTFQPPVGSAFPFFSGSDCELIDLDGDGDLDLASSYLTNVWIAFNESGNFLQSENRWGVQGVAGVVASTLMTGDIDSDDQADLVTFFRGDDISLLINSCFVLGDVNQDGTTNLLDVTPFVNLLQNSLYLPAADMNQDGYVDLLDVADFVAAITS